MKKSIFTLCGVLLFALTSLAASPDTLTVGTQNITSVTGTTTYSKVNLGSSTVPSFTPQQNGMWNLSNVTYDSSYSITRLSGPSPYTYSDTVFTGFKNFKYHYLDLNYVTVNGIATTAVEIDTQAYHNSAGLYLTISTITMGLNHLVSVLPLPLTYGNSYSTDTNKMKIVFHLIDTPLVIKAPVFDTLYRTFAENNSVVGYGNLVLKTTPGSSSDTAQVSVLQVRKKYYEVDSIYFKSITSSNRANYNIIMDTLGLTRITNANDSVLRHVQTDTLSKYQDLFYQYGSISPVMKVTYKHSNFDSVSRIEINTSGIFPAAVSNIVSDKNITVYPNPIMSNQFFIDIANANAGKWSYQVINTAGQLITGNDIEISGSNIHTAVSLPSNIPAGIYYLRVNNNSSVYTVKSLQVIK